MLREEAQAQADEAADETARHAADHEDREEEPRRALFLPISDEQQRQECAECTMRPAAQPHRKVQRDRRARKEGAHQLRALRRRVFRQG